MPNQRQLFLQHLAQTSATPLLLDIERGEGIYLYDRQGKAYMDLIAGIGVSSLGHCPPAVVAAVQAQASRYLHAMVYGEYVLSPQVQLASLLAAHLPGGLDSVYLTNSGTEATEGAMKLAKRHTGRHEIISCRQAYHGSTQGALSLMSEPYFTQAFRPLLPGVRHISYGCDFCLRQISRRTAAVVMETVQAEAGVRVPAPGYLRRVRERCDEVGALLILDEIQVGFGRTGSLFAFEQHGIVPDVLLLAKALGGGMPIGAFVARREVMLSLSERPVLGHITTFGGHPVSSAAAHAALQSLLDSGLIASVREKEALFRAELRHPAIVELRSAGLLMALELSDFDLVQRVIQVCLREGLITDWFLFNSKCLRIAPPLIITPEEIRRACRIIVAAIEEALAA